MTARCIGVTLTAEQRRLTNASPHMHPRYQMTAGKEYLVLGISFFVNSAVYGSCVLLEICDDAGRCVSIPSMLFQVLDPRPSRFWFAKRSGETDLMLWPEEFYRDYFHNDLSERDPDTVAIFNGVVARLEAEFGAPAALTVC